MAETSLPSFRHRAEFAAFKVADALLGHLPWGALQMVGRGIGAAFHAVDARHRRVARENLRAADLGLSEKEIRAVARACFRHYGALFIGLLKLRRATPEQLRAWIKVEGLEHFDAAAAEGKGFIQLTGHYGHWEAVALIQSLEGRPLAAIGRELDNPLLEPVSAAFRTRFGNTVILKDGGARGTLQALRHGRGVGFLLDQDALGAGIFVRCLGRWASTFPTAGAFATRYDLPILPVFSWPDGEGRIVVRFEAPFRAPRTGDAERDTWVATQAMTQRIEAQIRKDPRWWFWMHRRFKTQPGPGHPDLPPPQWADGWLRS
jgi:KDO2-lipid IV(A) lauroyltransferase